MLEVSEELGTLFTDDQEKYNKVFQVRTINSNHKRPSNREILFQDATFKQFHLRLSCKSENYNDESRVRYVVRAITDVDAKENCRKLVKDLEEQGEELPKGFNKAAYA